MFELGKLEYYLLVINAIGVLVYLINMLLYRHTVNGQIDVIVTIVSLLGGSAGMLLMILLFDRKAVKENMMSRVFIICIFIIQIIILLIYKGQCRAFHACILEIFCRTPDTFDISWNHESCNIHRICNR